MELPPPFEKPCSVGSNKGVRIVTLFILALNTWKIFPNMCVCYYFLLYFCTEDIPFQIWNLTVEFSHIKAVYITGKEVFSFKIVSYVDATAGSAYTDMDVVDIQVNLTVGCIEVVFVTKFLYSIMVSMLTNYFLLVGICVKLR